jgi:hypothetical protein
MPLALVLSVTVCQGETTDGLKLDFSRRSMTLEITVDDLQDAYRIQADGSIKMLAAPDATPVDKRQIDVQVSKGKRKTGLFTITVDGRSTEVQVASDNRLVGPSRAGGLPFGYAWLPPNGKATKGQTWEEEFPPPEGGDGPRVAATFRYTFAGAAPTVGCADCVEIRIVGLRRFLADRSLAGMVANVLADEDDGFFAGDQVFAIGSVLFSPKHGYFHRFEIGVNASMLTAAAVPGMMRRVVVETVEVKR